MQNNKPSQKQENKKKRKFDVLETPRLQQLNHRATLGFSTFIHKKRLTLFLGHMTPLRHHYGEKTMKNT
jgi:hypothetical protein